MKLLVDNQLPAGRSRTRLYSSAASQPAEWIGSTPIVPTVRALPWLDDRATEALAGWLANRAKTDSRYAEITAEFRNISQFDEIWQEIARRADDEPAASADKAGG